MNEIFARPTLLLAALAAAGAALALALLSLRMRSSRTRKLVAESVASRAGALLPSRGAAAALLVALTALGVGTALARPRWGLLTEKTEKKGSDVVVLLDTSASMRATDVSPSRIVLAKEAANSLLTSLGSDRVALVAVEGDAQTLVPLTMDLSAVGLFLDALEPGVGTLPGTSLAAGIAAASDLFPGGAPAGRTCVLISDGEDLEGGLDEAIARAKREGIVVHTVFVGAQGGSGAPVPQTDPAGRQTGFKTDESGKPVLSRPDPQLLRRIAAETGGSFSVVSTGRSDLDGVARAIERAASKRFGETLVTDREERFQIPLAVAVGALALLLLGLPEGLALRRATRSAQKLAALLLLILAASRAAAQGAQATQAPSPATQSAAAAPEPTPAPAPAPETGLLTHPPFTTARSEARKGAKALEAQKGDEAIRRFAHEAQLAPKDPTGPYNLGTAYAHAQRPDDAVATLMPVCRQALRNGAVTDACYNAGETFYRQEKWPEAAEAFRAALKTRPGDPDAAWNYELSLRRLKEQQQKQQQQKQQPKPTPSPKDKEDQKQKEERDFREKANMSREKAEQILAAISHSDEDEQKKMMAAKRSRRKVERDW